MTETPEHKPCPFCGGKGVYSDLIKEGTYAIRCSHCTSLGPEVVMGTLFTQELPKAAWNHRVSPWQPIETAPKDATAFLAYGRHTHSPDDAQRGVVAGDHWLAIIVWDAWREPHQWVFAKDGKPTWSEPTHWMPLPESPEAEK